jgi:uncharacterized membrane protein
VVQGNIVLVRYVAQSIAWGAGLALAVGLALGLALPLPDVTSELVARGGPSLLDLGVAVLSGCAGAYAMSRPNLSAALPGVAIAAALVPPLATLGIVLANGYWQIAQGAALLLATNVVGIILGSSVVLSLVGMQAKGNNASVVWVRRVYVGLVAALIIFAIPLGVVMLASLHLQEVGEVAARLRAVKQADLPGVITEITFQPHQQRHIVALDVPALLSETVLLKWHQRLRQHFGDSQQFEIRQTVVWRSDQAHSNKASVSPATIEMDD